MDHRRKTCAVTAITQGREGRLINVRKLVALDLTRHPACVWVRYAYHNALGPMADAHEHSAPLRTRLYLFFTGMNYVPLLLYAIFIARKGSAKGEVE